MTTNEDEMAGTTAEDYSHNYYNDAHLGGYGEYGWENAEWRGFFTMTADRIIGLTEPKSVLDVGCAKGLLVQALTYKGIDARGFDISDYAVNAAHEDVRDRLEVRSATEPIDGHYDLITCIEVLEHMSPEDAQKAIDVMCAAGDRILFSSSPADFEESTHINTQPTAQWAAWFAERGFYRRTDADVTFLTAWAILFEREEPAKRGIVERYERLLAPLQQEVVEKRAALLEAHRLASEAAAAKPAPLVVRPDDAAILATHAELVALDHVIGLEAQVAALTEQTRILKNRVTVLRERLTRLRSRVGVVKVAPPTPPPAAVPFSRRVSRRLRRQLRGSA